MKRLPAILAAVLLATGCGGGDNESSQIVTETTTPAETTDIEVYWLREGKVWPALRQVADTDAVATAALSELFDGPTEQEVADLDFTTAIPASEQSVWGSRLAISGGVADYSPPMELTKGGLAQVTYTLTQFSTVESVEIEGRTYTRADFEDHTPAILVESPLPFEEVDSPLRVTGTANTFEANFQYELTDTDGRIVDEGFVTATSGTGTRGTFDFTTDDFTVPFDGIGSLIVFESSAKDGSRINLVEIPLRMKR